MVDLVAVGTCYVDTNVENFPFRREQLVGEEIIGAAYEVVPGGSAVNFSRLCGQLGLKAAFIGMTGDDVTADALEELLYKEQIQPELIRRPDLQTNIGFNITNEDGDHVMFVAGTANAALSPADVLPHLENILPDARLLYLGGCLKLTKFVNDFQHIAQLARQTDTLLAVDHGRVPQAVSDEMKEAVKALVLSAAYYFPSREEFCALWNVASIDEGLKVLYERSPHLIVVVKDGSNGAHFLENGAPRQASAEKVDRVLNPTGAGDSFNAGTMTALLAGRSVAESAAYGCRVAAAKITSRPLPPLQ